MSQRFHAGGIPRPAPMPHSACIARVTLTGSSPLTAEPELFVTTVITPTDGVVSGAAEKEAVRRARMLGLVAPFEIREVVLVAQTLGPPSRPTRRGMRR